MNNQKSTPYPSFTPIVKTAIGLCLCLLLTLPVQAQMHCVIDPGLKTADQWIYFDVDGNAGTAEFAIISNQFSTKLFIFSALAQVLMEGGEIANVKPGRYFDGSETFGGGGEYILTPNIYRIVYRIYDGRLGFMQISVDPIGVVLDRYGTNATPRAPIIVDDCSNRPPNTRIRLGDIHNNGINLSWTTQDQGEVEGFELQRSTDGINFLTLDWISSQGRTAAEQRYTYADENLAPDMTYYYRLKELDTNGQVRLSNAVAGEVKSNIGSTISQFYPNPVFNQSTSIQLISEESADALITIYDGLGREMKQVRADLYPGSNTIELSLDNMPSGHYYALLRQGEKLSKRRFFIAR